MFQADKNMSKLKTNLKLAMNRLKLLQKKKAELTQKARKEIADSISAGKVERAKIRVEYIIREDYLIEALEIVEMFCDILLSRFGLVQQIKTLDPSIAEAVSSLLWVAPQLYADVSEMQVISDQLTLKYGKKYTEACRVASVNTISDKLQHKLSIQAPPKLLVEHYLIEIAKTYNIPYTPDPQIMKEEEQAKGLDALLFDGVPNNLDDGKGYPRPPGFVGYPQHPPIPNDYQPFNYPTYPPQSPSAPGIPPSGLPPGFPSGSNYPSENKVEPKAFSYNIPPSYSQVSNNNDVKPINTQPKPPSYSSNLKDPTNTTDKNKQSNVLPKPAPRSKMAPSDSILPELPSVPSDDVLQDLDNLDINNRNDTSSDNEIDFDDIAKRFEELKKKR